MTGEELKAIRKSLGLTQSDFGRILEAGRAKHYARYESGERPLPARMGKLVEMIRRHGLPEEWRRGK